MHNKLTKKDIELMRQELDHRRIVLRPKLLEEVKTARAFGDLSENFEYKAAKQEKNRNESRIRYLENMIRTSQVVEEAPAGEGAALYDKLTVTMPGGKTAVYQVVTTMRADPLQGRISLESPVGKALLGRKPGDTVHIQMGEGSGYDLVIQSIEKGQDDSQIPLNSY
ncbi:MAG: transcription elongation factor GreA [Oscillospiraceae bacterium]|nr:transcription elongation factor GreA [Oscillospiraceae bacterium]